MFGMVVEKLFIADLQKVSGTSEKKICAAGVTKLLTEAPAMISNYGELWYLPSLQLVYQFSSGKSFRYCDCHICCLHAETCGALVPVICWNVFF